MNQPPRTPTIIPTGPLLDELTRRRDLARTTAKRAQRSQHDVPHTVTIADAYDLQAQTLTDIIDWIRHRCATR
ncbi:hypothetical protein PG2093B_1029 [Bifidobacterium pseudolongum subsp. globosum]|uniref:Uncharacterized protein n=1 Tax=Bifidobacterium pseudolongum subsp. globosum TaxID=1690 RepID=A0A4Q5A0G4_9BIFI|nr:hypothetical protein [Bifidobacterium pseudolongum]RYQ10446.1 hypothetical protein PG2093B_1029 [Bifidobacterium pseudolongum subsp. globosum]